MGIKGLSKFLNKYHGKYNDSVCLRQCLLVIDGNNLMYFLLSNPRGVNAHLVGGDYILYAKFVREFFQHLKDCEITPIVIFDGAYEPEKWKTVFKRYKDNLKANVHSQIPGNSYTPVAMSTVFREILVEQRILHYQTEFEGDDTMAFIAKRLKCYLLSSDSDFYIYPDIQNIPLGTIEFRKSLLKKGNDKSQNQKRVHILSAKVLSLKRLCREEFKFQDLRLLPLAAVILGNDRISSTTFSNLHRNKSGDDKSHRIKYIFDWLGKHKDYDHVLTVILQALKEAERNEILNLVKTVLRNYQGENGEIQVWNLVFQDLKLEFEAEVDLTGISSYEEPLWYLPLHTNSCLPTYLLQILRNQTILLQPQVEISHLPSTHAISVDIIRVTAGILLGDAEITLVTRERKNVIRVQVQTLTELPNFGPIPTIQATNFKNKAQALLYCVFQLSPVEVEFVNQWPTPIKFLLMCLLFLFKKMRRSTTLRPMALALLLVYLKPIFESNQLNHEMKSSDSLVSLIRRQTSTRELIAFFNRFDTIAAFSKTRPYEISYASTFSQFQCLLVHSMMLSKLLGNPFRLPKLQFLNSHFIYNVMRSIIQTHGKNITEFLQQYFSEDDNSNLLNILTKFYSITNQMKKLSDTLPDQSSRESDADSNEEENVTESDEESENELNIHISNRFSKLKISKMA